MDDVHLAKGCVLLPCAGPGERGAKIDNAIKAERKYKGKGPGFWLGRPWDHVAIGKASAGNYGATTDNVGREAWIGAASAGNSRSRRASAGFSIALLI
jgi:hypothetical protein